MPHSNPATLPGAKSAIRGTISSVPRNVISRLKIHTQKSPCDSGDHQTQPAHFKDFSFNTAGIANQAIRGTMSSSVPRNVISRFKIHTKKRLCESGGYQTRPTRFQVFPVILPESRIGRFAIQKANYIQELLS
jgi:hypothetical protein